MMNVKLKTALQFMVATAIPLIAFALTNERYLRVGASFVAHEIRSHWVQVVILALIVAALLLPYMYARYKLFSEVAHQRAALNALQVGDVQSAADKCEKYLALYPQRRREGAIPDPVCVPLITFTEKMARLSDYVRAQEPRTVKIGSVWVPYATDARAAALLVLDAWAGRTPPPVSGELETTLPSSTQGQQ